MQDRDGESFMETDHAVRELARLSEADPDGKYVLATTEELLGADTHIIARYRQTDEDNDQDSNAGRNS